MTSLVAELHGRRLRFHADIARRAALVPEPEVSRTRSIPNTPYGVPKIGPPIIVQTPDVPYRNMWFYDLVLSGEDYRPGRAKPFKILIQDIQRAVANHYGVSVIDILSARRTVRVVRPRQVGYYLSKVMTLKSLPEIGRRFGDRDHTSILSGIRKIERLLPGDAALAEEVDKIRLTVEGGLA